MPGCVTSRAHARLAERGYVVAVPGVGMVVTPSGRWPRSADPDADADADPDL